MASQGDLWWSKLGRGARSTAACCVASRSVLCGDCRRLKGRGWRFEFTGVRFRTTRAPAGAGDRHTRLLTGVVQLEGTAPARHFPRSCSAGGAGFLRSRRLMVCCDMRALHIRRRTLCAFVAGMLVCVWSLLMGGQVVLCMRSCGAFGAQWACICTMLLTSCSCRRRCARDSPPVRMVRSRGRGLLAGRGYGHERQARFSGVRDAPAWLGATFVSVGACT